MDKDVIVDKKHGIPTGSVAAEERETAWLDPNRCPECGEETAGDGQFAPLCPRCLIWIALDGDATGEAGDSEEGASRETYPYRIVRVLGEGGMGIVYLAQQLAPVRRQVAVKVLKPGLDSKTVLARFEAERQALAMMDHPNIARVLEAGQTRAGRPYFVMELVEGEPITQYCDRRRLSLSERLELFVAVCRAVQHAHHKGIIHRDLKPSNILVTTTDDRPVPKVIDFGLAKATGASLTDETLVTRQGEFMGTPAYMSPEQAALDGVRLDTRTDVYSLGVVLYELLAGAPPLESDTLRRASHAEILRILREEEPPRPSQRMSDPSIDPAVAAVRRQSDAVALRRRLHGDLDWIVLKALAKDRARRYPTPHALATDVIRHLNHELVEAGPPSALYRFRKFARRNRVALGVTAAVAFGVLAAAAGLSVALAESIRQRTRVESALGQVERARNEAEAVVGFLEETLAAADPREQGRDVTVREAVDEAASTIETRFAEQPLVEARLRATIGRTYKALGVYDAAAPHLERAVETRREMLGEGDPQTLESMSDLGGLRMQQGRYDEAAAIFEEAIEVGRRVAGPNESVVLHIMGNLGATYTLQGRYDEAAPVLEEALRASRATAGAEDDLTAGLLKNLADLYAAQGRYDEAEPLFREVVRSKRRTVGDEHPDTLASLSNLAVLHLNQGRYAQAEPLLDEALRTERKILGDEHPGTLSSMNNLAILYVHLGRYDEAEPLLEEALRIEQRVLGEEHPSTLTSLSNLAAVYSKQGRPAEASSLIQKALPTVRRTLGADHIHTATLTNNLGALLYDQGRYTEARAVLEEALRTARAAVGDEHPMTLTAMNLLGLLHLEEGRYDEAERSLRQVMEARARLLGEEHVSTLISANSLATTLHHQRRYDEAEAIYDRLADVTQRTLGDDHPETLTNHNNRARLYQDTGRYDDAERLYEAALEGRRRVLGEEHPATLAVIGSLGHLYSLQGRPEEAERALRQALEVGMRTMDPGHPVRINLQAELALVCSRQERYPEAETVLLTLYEALPDDESGVQRGKTARALADLYDSWGRAEQAAVWREKAGGRNTSGVLPEQSGRSR